MISGNLMTKQYCYQRLVHISDCCEVLNKMKGCKKSTKSVLSCKVAFTTYKKGLNEKSKEQSGVWLFIGKTKRTSWEISDLVKHGVKHCFTLINGLLIVHSHATPRFQALKICQGSNSIVSWSDPSDKATFLYTYLTSRSRPHRRRSRFVMFHYEATSLAGAIPRQRRHRATTFHVFSYLSRSYIGK